MRVNIWIQKEHEEFWKALDNGSGWVNDKISSELREADTNKEKKYRESQATYNICKHGSVKGLCKKGCK